MKGAPGTPGGKLTFVAVTSSRRELLRSPVSGVACVHWRLRIVEQVDPSLRLVHEIASTEEFDLTRPGMAAATDRSPAAWNAAFPLALPAVGSAGAVRVRVVPEAASISGHAVLHRPGSPGAIAVGRQFGFSGMLSVEEVTLRAGEEVVAEGVVEAEAGIAAGPYRSVERDFELHGAMLRLPARAVLAPVLLPWALGTAAALLGGVAVATWAAWKFDLVPRVHGVHDGTITVPSDVGPHRHTRRHFSQPE